METFISCLTGGLAALAFGVWIRLNVVRFPEDAPALAGRIATLPGCRAITNKNLVDIAIGVGLILVALGVVAALTGPNE